MTPQWSAFNRRRRICSALWFYSFANNRSGTTDVGSGQSSQHGITETCPLSTGMKIHYLLLPNFVPPPAYQSIILLSLCIALSLSITVDVHRVPVALRHTPLTWPQSLGTVKLPRLPRNLAKCRAQAPSKLLNNRCVPMATSALTALAN